MKSISSCKYTRTLVAGFAFAIIAYLNGWFVWMFLFGEETMAHATLWRSHNDPKMMNFMILGYVVAGVSLAYAYRKFYHGITCNDIVSKGLCFGTKLWLIFGLGYGIFWYGLMPISAELLIASLIDSAIALIIGSTVVAIIFGRLPETCEAGCSMHGNSGSGSKSKKSKK